MLLDNKGGITKITDMRQRGIVDIAPHTMYMSNVTWMLIILELVQKVPERQIDSLNVIQIGCRTESLTD